MKYRRQNPFDVLSNTKYVSEMFLKIWYRYETKQGQHVTLVAQPVTGADRAVAGAVEVTVAEADEALAELLGCLKGATYATVDNMAVAPEHRKKGLGKLLLSACESLVPELQLSMPGVVALYVYKSNFPAIMCVQLLLALVCHGLLLSATAWVLRDHVKEAHFAELTGCSCMKWVKSIQPVWHAQAL